MSDALPAPTVEEVEAIIALAHDPALRNLRVTQAYHDLSQAFVLMIGREHVSWCTFGVWASKTAGRFIRLRALDTEVDRILAETAGWRRWLIRLLDKKLASLNLRHASLRSFIDEVAAKTSQFVTEGNLTVFAELGRLYATLLHTLAADTTFDAARLARFADTLKPGPTEDGGQDRLRDAATHYYQARFETDPKRKAEHILRANAETGLHEQMRLQDTIAGSFNAPVAEGLHELCDEVARALPGGFLNQAFKLLLPLIRRFAVGEVQRRWQEVMTEHLMEIRLPDATLRLGRDIPARPGQPPFPPLLQSIDDEPLRNLLARFHAADASLRGSQAENWADLDERMGYIFDLFRSRQQDQGLLVQPFTAEQRRAIAAGLVPEGSL